MTHLEPRYFIKIPPGTCSNKFLDILVRLVSNIEKVFLSLSPTTKVLKILFSSVSFTRVL